MPATRSVTARAGSPHALIEALLRGDTATALSLLEARASTPGAAPPALVHPVGNSGLTALHAAVLGRCTPAIPAVVAAGAPLDVPLQLPAGGIWSEGATPLRELLQAFGHAAGVIDNGATALSLAVRKEDVACVRQLLEQGADPAAGNSHSVLRALWCMDLGAIHAAPPPFHQLLALMLQHGVDPLAPTLLGELWVQPDSLLGSCHLGTLELLLAHLEQQRAAGSLHLGSAARAAQLLAGIARSRNGEQHLQLAHHGVAALEQLLGLAGVGVNAGGGGQLPPADVGFLQRLLVRVVAAGREAGHAAGQLAVLEALLASRLPFDLARKAVPWDCSLLSLATARSNVCTAACVRLLHQAGAPLTAVDLYGAIDALSPDCVSALLACGAPAVDVSVPYAHAFYSTSWSCPIHRALQAALQRDAENSRHTAKVLEALWAAGYRPTVYRQARLPHFLEPSSTAPVFAELDPLALYDAAHPQHTQLRRLVSHWTLRRCQSDDPATTQRLAFLACTGGAWSPATHRHWPPAFKQAACTLLLCAAADGSSGRTADGAQRVTRAAARRRPQRTLSEAARLLAALPQDTLLHLLKLAAAPLSAWL